MQKYVIALYIRLSIEDYKYGYEKNFVEGVRADTAIEI